MSYTHVLKPDFEKEINKLKEDNLSLNAKIKSLENVINDKEEQIKSILKDLEVIKYNIQVKDIIVNANDDVMNEKSKDNDTNEESIDESSFRSQNDTCESEILDYSSSVIPQLDGSNSVVGVVSPFGGIQTRNPDGSYVVWNCDRCDFCSGDENELLRHKIANHKQVVVRGLPPVVRGPPQKQKQKQRRKDNGT